MSRALPADLAMVRRWMLRTPSTPLPAPRFTLEDGQDLLEWQRAIGAVRAAHDASAVRGREALVVAQRAVLGTDARSLLGSPPTPASRRTWSVPVIAGGLAALLPGIELDPALATSPVDAAHAVGTLVSSPAGASAAPAIVRLHGGAFWMGGGATRIRIDRDLVDHLCARLGAVVIDVDYRLAPEHPFPAPVIDALAVLDAVRAAAGPLGVDPARIAIVGTSSGGSIAVLTALLDAMRSPAAPIAALGLVVPSLDLTAMTDELRASPAGWAARQRQLRAYLGDVPAASPWVSPALADRLPGVPPTHVAVATFDEIASGAAATCAALEAGGGEAIVRDYPMTHTLATPAVEAAVIRDLGEFLAERLGAC